MKKLMIVLASTLLASFMMNLTSCDNLTSSSDSTKENSAEKLSSTDSSNADKTSSDTTITTDEVDKLTAQIEVAKETYNNIYDAGEKRGGMFSDTSKTNSLTTNNNLKKSAESESTVEEVRNIIQKYQSSYPSFANWAASFIGDIFSYSQIQLSIINQYSEESLINNFKMDYSKVDWNVFDYKTFGQATWFIRIHSDTASFPGVDTETGRVYCQETHITSRKLNAETTIEYFYNSDDDLGVTTLNYQTSPESGEKTFEYYYFDITGNMVLVGYYDISDDGSMSFDHFSACYPGNQVDSFMVTADENNFINEFILSEISRISTKSEELKANNAKIAENTNLEVSKDLLPVTVEYSADTLKRMLGK